MITNDSDPITVSVLVDNTSNYNFLTNGLDRTYQIITMIRDITQKRIKLRLITIHPDIRVITHNQTEKSTQSIFSVFNRMYRQTKKVPPPSGETINSVFKLIGSNDIFIMVDEDCVFKNSPELNTTIKQNVLNIVLYKSMKYDRDSSFYDSRDFMKLRFLDDLKLRDYSEVSAILCSPSVVERSVSYDGILGSDEYIADLESHLDSNSLTIPTEITHHTIERLYSEQFRQIYLLENLFRSIDTGYIWSETDTMTFKFNRPVTKDDSNQVTELAVIKQTKLTIKQMVDHFLHRLSEISQNVIKIYLTMQKYIKENNILRELNIHMHHARYLISALLSRIEEYTKENDYSGPTYSDKEECRYSDSDSDSDSDSESESEDDINITQIGKTWKRFNKFCATRLTKKIDLNYSADLKNKIRKIVEAREDQMDEVEDKFESESMNADIKSFYNSTLTLKNWIDVLRSGNSIGLNMNVDIESYMKSRYHICLMSEPKLMGTTSEFFDGIRARGFIDIVSNDHCIDGVFGNSNAMLPLFISNLNWKVAKHYVDPICNMVVNNSHMIKDDGAWRIYYIILIDYTSCLTNIKKIDRHTIRRYLAFWFTAYNLTRDRRVVNIQNYLKNAIRNNYELDAGMIGGQLLTLLDRSGSIRDKIIDYCLRNIVRSYIGRDTEDEISSNMIYDENYIQIYRLMILNFATQVFNDFFKENGSERDFVKSMIRRYSIATDNEADTFIRLMEHRLSSQSMDDREKEILDQIEQIIKEEHLTSEADTDSQAMTSDLVEFT